jgi:acetyl-CoA carboxylase biotin carboxyl carrier protein
VLQATSRSKKAGGLPEDPCDIQPAAGLAKAAGGVPPCTRRDPMATEIKAHITGTIWKIKAAAGDQVDEGDVLIIIESMKMEMPIEAQDPGTVKEVRCKEGQPVTEGDVLMVVDD